MSLSSKEVGSFSFVLLTGGEEIMNEEIVPIYRADQTMTLGSREVGTSSSRLNRVEALIDRIAESLNYHETDLPDSEREKIVQSLDHQITDVCDAHLEDALGLNFEEMDSDIEERVNELDLMPLDLE